MEARAGQWTTKIVGVPRSTGHGRARTRVGDSTPAVAAIFSSRSRRNAALIFGYGYKALRQLNIAVEQPVHAKARVDALERIESCG